MSTINVNVKDIEDSINNLDKNNKFFVIKGNLFTIDKILTLKAVKDETENIDHVAFDNTYLEFSYADECNNESIRISYDHEDYSCISFVKNCKNISENEISQIMEKSIKIASEKFKYTGYLLTKANIDSVFFNEVLVYISSKINENDKSDLKDDFISKYELYKNHQMAKISETKNMLNKLHDMLLNIKVSENKASNII